MKKLLPLLLLFAILSCKKESGPSTEELLTKRWMMTSRDMISGYVGTPMETSSTNLFNPANAWDLKIQHFKADGTFLLERSPTLPNDFEFEGGWALSDDRKLINVHYKNGTLPDFSYQLIEISPSLLKVQRVEQFGPVPGEADVTVQYRFRPAK